MQPLMDPAQFGNSKGISIQNLESVAQKMAELLLNGGTRALIFVVFCPPKKSSLQASASLKK